MNNAGPRHPADAAEMAGAMVKEGVDQRVGRMARRRVNDQSGRLVQRQQVVVLVKDGPAECPPAGLGRTGGRPAHADDFAGPGMMGGFGGEAIDPDFSLPPAAAEWYRERRRETESARKRPAVPAEATAQR